MVDANGKTLRSKAPKNPSKPISSKQACNGNCQACNKTCSGEDLAIDCTKCLSRFHLTCSDVSKKFYDVFENNKMQQVGLHRTICHQRLSRQNYLCCSRKSWNVIISPTLPFLNCEFFLKSSKKPNQTKFFKTSLQWQLPSL